MRRALKPRDAFSALEVVVENGEPGGRAGVVAETSPADVHITAGGHVPGVVHGIEIVEGGLVPRPPSADAPSGYPSEVAAPSHAQEQFGLPWRIDYPTLSFELAPSDQDPNIDP